MDVGRQRSQLLSSKFNYIKSSANLRETSIGFVYRSFFSWKKQVGSMRCGKIYPTEEPWLNQTFHCNIAMMFSMCWCSINFFYHNKSSFLCQSIRFVVSQGYSGEAEGTTSCYSHHLLPGPFLNDIRRWTLHRRRGWPLYLSRDFKFIGVESENFLVFSRGEFDWNEQKFSFLWTRKSIKQKS